MLPHEKVYTRLGISKIHGIGVIAIRDIPKNTLLFEFDNSELVWIESDKLINLPDKLKKLYDDFCIIKDNGKLYGCPENFNQLTAAWYLNCSDTPNVVIDESYNFYAKFDIKEGEELTVDYNTFSEQPKP